MKRINVLGFVLMSLILTLSSCQHFSTKEAVKVNDEVVDYQKSLMAALEVFVTSLESKDQKVILDGLQGLKSAANFGVVNLSDIEDPACNQEFVLKAKDMFSYYLEASYKDYKTIAYLYSADSISYEEYDSLQLLVKRFKVEQEKVNQTFLSAQRDFANDCGFKLVRNAN